MINPHMLEPKYGRFSHPKLPGGKVYFAHVGRATRLKFRRATSALAYARNVKNRWVRLYDAAVEAMSSQKAEL